PARSPARPLEPVNSKPEASPGGKPPKRPQPTPGARDLAHAVLLRVETEGAFADRALDAMLGRVELPARERAFATELVYGTLRRALFLDFVLAKLASQPLKKMAKPTLVALRLGAYQLLHTRAAAHG